jgi:serine/threonine protein kinase
MTVDGFLQEIAQSGLIDRRTLQRQWSRTPTDVRDSAEQLADWFVVEGLLTEFQAAKLLKGASRGLLIDNYEIQAFLGKGGMGNVYLAYDRLHQRHCAMKILTRSGADHRHVLRFLREIEVSSRLQHPNIAVAYESGTWQGVYYLTLEYVRGLTLYRLIKRGGPLPVYWATRWAAEVAGALDYAHQMGVIHRDLKPSNVIVTPQGRSKLLDLGLARWYEDDHNEERVVGRRRVVGSFDYIAPEQGANSARADARSDIYALGCLMYFMLAGRPPFAHVPSIREKMRYHCEVEPAAIQSLRPELPNALVVAISKLMHKDPLRRFQVAGEARDVLQKWSEFFSAGGTVPDLPTPLRTVDDPD